jgi:hypothetical protein
MRLKTNIEKVVSWFQGEAKTVEQKAAIIRHEGGRRTGGATDFSLSSHTSLSSVTYEKSILWPASCATLRPLQASLQKWPFLCRDSIDEFLAHERVLVCRIAFHNRWLASS